jgi:hypothetical protein
MAPAPVVARRRCDHVLDEGTSARSWLGLQLVRQASAVGRRHRLQPWPRSRMVGRPRVPAGGASPPSVGRRGVSLPIKVSLREPGLT